MYPTHRLSVNIKECYLIKPSTLRFGEETLSISPSIVSPGLRSKIDLYKRQGTWLVSHLILRREIELKSKPEEAPIWLLAICLGLVCLSLSPWHHSHALRRGAHGHPKLPTRQTGSRHWISARTTLSCRDRMTRQVVHGTALTALCGRCGCSLLTSHMPAKATQCQEQRSGSL
jgi:hypothetical protein